MDTKGRVHSNRLKRDLAAGKVCIGATITISSSIVAEIMSRVGLDWLWFEAEHTTLDFDNVLTMLQAANGSEVSTVIRVPYNDKTMIKRALDTGADGLIIPLVNSREEAEYAVKAMKYPPWGERGAGLARAQGYGLSMGEYLETANEETMTILMIEHIDAVNKIEEILSVKGVDSVMVGALDLSGSMGMLGQTGAPVVEEAVQKVLAASKKANVSCGIVAVGAEQANLRIEQGFTNIILGIDVLYLHGSVQAALGQINRPS